MCIINDTVYDKKTAEGEKLMGEEFLQERISNLDRIAHYIIPLITAVGDYIAIILAEKLYGN